jgi:hypothetical protein
MALVANPVNHISDVRETYKSRFRLQTSLTLFRRILPSCPDGANVFKLSLAIRPVRERHHHWPGVIVLSDYVFVWRMCGILVPCGSLNEHLSRYDIHKRE